jgi:hypothetical protein
MPAPEKRKYYRIHIAYLIMIFTLKQGTSISGIQQILPPSENEEDVKAFYTSYVELVQSIGVFYTTQTRDAMKDVLDPATTEDGAVERVIIQSILMSGFSRILGEKLLRLRDADPEAVRAMEKISDESGVHPLSPTRKED